MRSLALHYSASSALGPDGLFLASSAEPSEGEAFFEGRLADPELLRIHLRALLRLVQADYRPFPAGQLALDPVVTASQGILRFEGVSGCAGAYGRVDLTEAAFVEGTFGRGTTNVDLGPSMVASLERAGLMQGQAALRVSREGMDLETDSGLAVEKKVRLPQRWVRSFAEVAVHERSLEPRFELEGAAARALFRSAPRKVTKEAAVHLVPTAAGRARWSLSPRPGSVAVFGPQRLGLLSTLLGSRSRLQVFCGADGISAFRVAHRAGAFTLLLSPRVDRGFAGLGAGFLEVADAPVARCQAALAWLGSGSTDELSARVDLSREVVAAGLTRLARIGRAGYDAARGRFFHRELPYALEDEERLHPRLGAARRLAREGAVQSMEGGAYAVRGTSGTYRVEIGPQGEASCTCAWARSGGVACKHVLAALMLQGESDER